MGFSYFNPNPEGKQVGDCTVRAIAKATGKSWDSGNVIPLFYWEKEDK